MKIRAADFTDEHESDRFIIGETPWLFASDCEN